MNGSGKLITVLTFIIVLLSVAVVMQGKTIHKLNLQNGQKISTEEDSKNLTDKKTAKANPLSPLLKKDNGVDNWPSLNFNNDDWDPFQEMEQIHDRMNNMFNDAFGHFQLSPKFNNLFREKDISPSFDISDDGDHYTATVDMPGIDKSNIEVNVDGQTLTISGKIDKSKEQKEKGRIIRKERRSGNFKRSITLPEPVKADAVKTEVHDGIIKITIPKEKDTSTK
jgi:HSP20 family protein